MKAAALALGTAVILVGLLGTLGPPSEAEPIPSASSRTAEIRDFRYVPRNITVLVGTTVTWTNFDLDAHTVTADDGTWDSYAGGDPTTEGESWSYTFNVPGVREYTCFFHPWMHGRVTVYSTSQELQAPEASFTVRVDRLRVSVDASSSSDPDGTIVGYEWDFGDGATAQGVSTDHTYAAAGSFTVTLTIADDAGGTSTAQEAVEVETPPPAGDPTTTLAVLGAAVAIGVVAIGVVVARRRKGRPPG